MLVRAEITGALTIFLINSNNKFLVTFGGVLEVQNKMTRQLLTIEKTYNSKMLLTHLYTWYSKFYIPYFQ